MLPDCLTMRFNIGEDYFNLTINNPIDWLMTSAMSEAQGKLVAAISDANRQLRTASQHCKHFTAIPYSSVIKPIREELEKEFQNFRRVMESSGCIRDLNALRDDFGFVRHWRYSTAHKDHPGFYVLNFCCLGGECWFGPASKYPPRN